MHFRLLTALFLISSIHAFPQRDYWQDHTVFRVNKEEPHASFYHYPNSEAAMAGDRELAAGFVSLNGLWKFHFSGKPAERPLDFFLDNFDLSNWADIKVPANWEVEGYDHPIYLDEKYPFETQWPDAPQDYNPVGSYKRYFTFDGRWKGQEVILHLGAVNSAALVWINGKQVGYSEDSKTPAEFNITSYLNPGSNSVSLQIFRWSDGSYLEAQDMLKLSGIERDIFIYTRPKVTLVDLFAKPQVDLQTKDGLLDLTLQVKNYFSQKINRYTINIFLLDGRTLGSIWNTTRKLSVDGNGSTNLQFSTTIKNPELWSAETPNLYVLLISIVDSNGNEIDFVTTRVGFRKVEIRNGQLLINGAAIKIKGVNRHEAHALNGHVMTEEIMLKDIELMKKANINAVRSCHYPNNPLWYDLMDQYGFYIVDEVNIESQPLALDESTKLGKELSWLPAHLDRTRNMFERDKNHASIIIWSLGNESGDGQVFDSTYQYLHRVDNTRPVMYEPAKLKSYTDIFCPMYPSIKKIEDYVKTNPSRPLIMCEYAHVMGNSGGNLQDYWDVIEAYPVLQGGFIWEWADQGLLYRNKDGVKYMAYGNDYHPGLPTDGAFVNKGLVNGVREPIPHYYEVQKVYQPVKFIELNKEGEYEFLNKYDFISTDHLNIHWEMTADGVSLAKGELGIVSTSPGKRQKLKIQLPQIAVDDHREFIIKLSARINKQIPFLPIGFEVGWDQFIIKDKISTAQIITGKLSTLESRQTLDISSKDFNIQFDKTTGDLTNFSFKGIRLINSSIKPNFWRAPTDNDLGNNMQEWAKIWRDAGEKKILQNFSWRSVNEREVNVTCRYDLTSISSLLTLTYTIRSNGQVKLNYEFIPGNKPLPNIPRVGLTFTMPSDFEFMSWYGRGPHESYQDRKSSAAIGIYSGNVEDQTYLFPRPQEAGNRTDIRWMTLNNSSGTGLRMIANEKLLSVSAWVFSQEQLDYKMGSGISASGLVPSVSKHSYDVVRRNFVTVNVDLLQMGVGGDNSWGAPVHEQYQIKPAKYSYSFVLIPCGL